jgi:hypothetical protein
MQAEIPTSPVTCAPGRHQYPRAAAPCHPKPDGRADPSIGSAVTSSKECHPSPPTRPMTMTVSATHGVMAKTGGTTASPRWRAWHGWPLISKPATLNRIPGGSLTGRSLACLCGPPRRGGAMRPISTGRRCRCPDQLPHLPAGPADLSACALGSHWRRGSSEMCADSAFVDRGRCRCVRSRHVPGRLGTHLALFPVRPSP